ncbi:tRNA 2-thiouridine(34) synthase MnmA [Ectothiorhodospira mobilis]|uniref:tRNA 2-thiouridine(34) synthase MnmA n=1 Tax=Ectothiorhodospira mobilis TaxID=195064 RepID=UPI00190869AE|nr:tRNA 2-thiouridine(34) synthase MnmA [Ectothiorhodospira mobilis]MBK1690791.1 tRNA 2-thiouridine(34) synthase MnmA [Ectothiorhodospira mobilis]
MPYSRAQRILVGLSGGVDSSVAALRLLQQGYRVEGLFMKNWEDDDEPGYCAAARDLEDARAVCEDLEIPLHKVNFARDYRDRVFTHFLAEYEAGRTPNPDILCNREIKFRAFLDYALEKGADCIATGHYARVEQDPKTGEWQLLQGADPGKDQSYFLHALGQRALSRTLFPLGDLHKSAVREMAAEAGFVNHAKKDSTGICFIGERRFRDFLQRYLPARPGEIVDPEGRILGAHQGLMYYTPGQRQGLGIGGTAGGAEAPWYVAGKDLARNRLIVVQGHDHPALQATALSAGEVHWIRGTPEPLPLRCQAKIRYRQPHQDCVVEPDPHGRGDLRVRFDRPQRAVAPGQSVVFYRGAQCLGGGVITAREPLCPLPGETLSSSTPEMETLRGSLEP